jgi:hypothetical protein
VDTRRVMCDCDHCQAWHVAGQTERKPCSLQVLLMASGKNTPVSKKAPMEQAPGRSALNFWAFVADITEELILGLNVLQTCDPLVDMACHVPRLGREISVVSRTTTTITPA